MSFFNLSEDKRRNGSDHDEHPRRCEHPPDHPLPSDFADSLGPNHRHQPVDAHQHDEVNGGVHVEQTEVEEDLAHHFPNHPVPCDQVDNEERSESHQRSISKCQVEDEEGCDGLFFSSSQDAPDDKDVSRESHEEDKAQDEGAHVCASCIVHDGLIVLRGVSVHLHFLPKTIDKQFSFKTSHM